MKKYANYILRAGLVLLGVFLAAASKVLLPLEMGTFWRVFIELTGYAVIAVGIGVPEVLKNKKS